jgi:trk system potassium uptake protein TrkH
MKYFGQLLLVVAALTLFPLAVSLISRETSITFRYSIVVGGLGLLGWLFSKKRASEEVQVNEGIVLVASVFLVISFVMSYPLMASSGLHFSDAFFEAVSGVTTTGLSTLGTVQDKTTTFLFSRAWMQWYGGLGIVVLSLALLFRPGRAAKKLSVTEAEEEDLVGGTKAHARRVFTVYGAITLLGVLLLLLTGVDPLNALVYTLASVSTGGYAPYDASLRALGGLASEWGVIVLCLACAIPLSFYPVFFRKGWRTSPNAMQLVGLLVACLAVSLLLGLSMRVAQQSSWMEILEKAPILALSAQTTAGFSNADVSLLPASAKLALIVAMALGGGVGSTAGGFKILRLLILIGLVRLVIKRTCVSKHAVVVPRVAGQKMVETDVQESVLIVMLFVVGIVFSWLSFVFMGYAPLDSLFEVVSAIGTVGLSSGVTSMGMPGFLKGVLCADMLLGRLEILAWLIMFYPKTWVGRRL